MQVPLTSGKRCRFRLADVLCPDRQQIIGQVTPQVEVCGEIVMLSDAGQEPRAFAVIEVDGIASPLVVSVAHLRLDASGAEGDPLETRYERVGLENQKVGKSISG